MLDIKDFSTIEYFHPDDTYVNFIKSSQNGKFGVTTTCCNGI